MLTHLKPEDVPAVKVGPGCYRRDLPTVGDVRAWFVEIEAGAEWPAVDYHDELGEEVVVLWGELIEGDNRYGAGTYLFYGPGSHHQPRSETGVGLFGFNLVQRDGSSTTEGGRNPHRIRQG